MNASKVAERMTAPVPTRVTRPSKVYRKSENKTATFDYEAFYEAELDRKKQDKSYRYFNNINRLAEKFPQAHLEDPNKLVTAWCSNDYVCFPTQLIKYD